jgi:hypothetical protein
MCENHSFSLRMNPMYLAYAIGFLFLVLVQSSLFASNTLRITFADKGLDQTKTNDFNQSIAKRLFGGEIFEQGDFLTTGPDSYGELSGKFPRLVRLGSNSILEWKSIRDWKLYEGSALFCLEFDNTITLDSKNSSTEITGPTTFIAECTSNGGLKFIILSGSPTLKNGTKSIKLPGGRLVLVTSSSFGNAYDIDLLLLLQSSRLFAGFESPLPSMKKIGLAVFAQHTKLQGKYNALIGDATSDKDLQMYILGAEK